MERAVSFAALDYNTDAWKESRQEFGSFEIAPSELECFECIGSGSFGDVYRGNVRGKECAIKKLKGQVRVLCRDRRAAAAHMAPVHLLRSLAGMRV